jgi:hypothetical protein
MTRRIKWNGDEDDDEDEDDSDDDDNNKGHYSNDIKGVGQNRKGNYCDLVWTGKVYGYSKRSERERESACVCV